MVTLINAAIKPLRFKTRPQLGVTSFSGLRGKTLSLLYEKGGLPMREGLRADERKGETD